MLDIYKINTLFEKINSGLPNELKLNYLTMNEQSSFGNLSTSTDQELVDVCFNVIKGRIPPKITLEKFAEVVKLLYNIDVNLDNIKTEEREMFTIGFGKYE